MQPFLVKRGYDVFWCMAISLFLLVAFFDPHTRCIPGGVLVLLDGLLPSATSKKNKNTARNELIGNQSKQKCCTDHEHTFSHYHSSVSPLWHFMHVHVYSTGLAQHNYFYTKPSSHQINERQNHVCIVHTYVYRIKPFIGWSCGQIRSAFR